MKLSTQTHNLGDRFGEKQAITLLIAAGYEALDLSCFDMTDDDCPKCKPGYKEYAKELLDIAGEAGVYFNQAHAPFPSSFADGKKTEWINERILKSMEFASLLGVRNIIVHPKQHLKYVDNTEYLKELNIEYYKSLIPYAEQMNINVCMENMWQTDETGRITHSTCSRLTEFREYLEAVNHPRIKACLDIGHAQLMPEDIPAFIKGLMPYLDALHVHSTGFNVDLHVLPFTAGYVDWEAICRALAESGYTGELTFEADNTLRGMPEALLPTAAKFMADVGHYLTRRVDYYCGLKNKLN